MDFFFRLLPICNFFEHKSGDMKVISIFFYISSDCVHFAFQKNSLVERKFFVSPNAILFSSSGKINLLVQVYSQMVEK